MKRKIANVIILLIFLAGLAILLYPTVSDYVNEKNSSRAIAAYDQSAQDMAPEDYSQELEAAAAYNAYLAQYGSLSAAASAEAKREDNPYETLLNAGGNGVMAVIRIPCVDINLPVYHGTDEAVLQVAAGHYLGSSCRRPWHPCCDHRPPGPAFRQTLYRSGSAGDWRCILYQGFGRNS